MLHQQRLVGELLGTTGTGVMLSFAPRRRATAGAITGVRLHVRP